MHRRIGHEKARVDAAPIMRTPYCDVWPAQCRLQHRGSGDFDKYITGESAVQTSPTPRPAHENDGAGTGW